MRATTLLSLPLQMHCLLKNLKQFAQGIFLTLQQLYNKI